MVVGRTLKKDTGRKESRLSIREAHEKVANDEIGRLGIVQQILRKSTASCGASSRQSMESSCHGDGNNRKKKHCNWWCAACGGQSPNRILVVQLGVNANEAKVFKAQAAPLGLCDNLINALKLLANQQRDGDSPTQSIVTSLHERSEVSFKRITIVR